MRVVERLIYTDNGKAFISVILGLGLASLFRSACNMRGCIVFRHADIDDIDGETYKVGNKCYRYDLYQESCSLDKKILKSAKQKHGV
tara:strand:- start:241 stop:501 length:261 start_codon:yes stop_codon:yes gene_type:complete